MPVKSVYYLPVDETFAHEERHCGVYSGGYNNGLTEFVKFSIHGTLSDGDLWLNFQFVIDEGHSLRFTSNLIALRASDGDTRSAVISESSGDNYPSLDPSKTMVHAFPDLLIANVMISNFDPEVFTLSLPAVEADGIEFELVPIEFSRQEKRGLLYCIQ